jgi:hypothetical protein
MTAPTLDSFFAGGGGKSVSWKDKPIGTSVTGTIKTVHPPAPQIDPVTQQPVVKNGVAKMQVRIDLLTAERDASDPDDDGTRSLYVKGWMQGAIGDAMRKAGVQGAPQVGAKLHVELTEREPNVNPALNPTNKFKATYEPPSSAATGEFFSGGPITAVGGGGGAAAEPEPQRPAAITQAAWDSMPLEAKKSVAATMGGSDEPPF